MPSHGGARSIALHNCRWRYRSPLAACLVMRNPTPGLAQLYRCMRITCGHLHWQNTRIMAEAYCVARFTSQVFSNAAFPVQQRYFARKVTWGANGATRLVGLAGSIKFRHRGFCFSAPVSPPLCFSAQTKKIAFKSVGPWPMFGIVSPICHAWG